jgi:uncharacterized protein (TIGR03437 family)
MKVSLIFLIAVATLPLSAQLPYPQVRSIANGATFVSASGYTGGSAPGLIVSIFGTFLSNGATVSAPGTPLPTLLGGTRVLINGIPAPLYYISPTQINAQSHTEFEPPVSVSVKVEVQWPDQTLSGTGPNLQLLRFAPGIFTLDANGFGPAAVLRSSDYSLICPPGRADCTYNPAHVGEAVSIFAVGLGPVDGPWSSGTAASGPVATTTTPKVWIGSVPATVLYAGVAPGFAGLYQINVLVPGGVAGDNVGLGLSMDSTPAGQSNTVSIPVAAVVSCPSSEPIGGPPGGKPTALAAHPRDAGVVFAGTDGNGLFKSADAGRTWNQITSLNQMHIYAIAFAPSDPGVIYAATELGVYRSRDGGATWTDVALRYGGPATALAVDPNNAALVYAGHLGVGLIKSVDGGDNWTVSYPQPPSMPFYIQAITIQPGFPNVIYMAFNPGAVVRSDDAGQTWNPPGVGLPNNVQVYSLLNWPTGTSLFVGTNFGTYLSADSGRHWTSQSAGMSGVAVHTLLWAGSLYYAGTTQGVYWSFNSGDTWAPINRGLPVCSILAMAADAKDSHTLYAATATAGVYKSTDGGYTWLPSGN